MSVFSNVAENGTRPLWLPSQASVEHSQMYAFMQECNRRYGVSLANFPELHSWSVDEFEKFWLGVWEFCDVKGERGVRLFEAGETMPAGRFFPDAALNYAENLLAGRADGDAIIFRGEDKVCDRWSWDRLIATVSRLQQSYRAMGIGPGDRIAAMMPNIPETVAAMLAAASIGAVWSSCSPDFGEQGVMERFGQISPKLFISCDAYWYGGKSHNVSAKAISVANRLDVPLVLVSYAGGGQTDLKTQSSARSLVDFIAPFEADEVKFERFPFDHPLFILFSSGTTGSPKCIVHSAGGALLQHVKEHRLHCDLRVGEKLFYYTTCGWMMWNWLVSGLASGATLCLYDGSPFSPNEEVLFDYAQDERFSFFGTSAKYLDAVRKSGISPSASHDLAPLRMIASTGSPLSPEGFAFVYQSIKSEVHLASISGGTDIVSCFVLGNPMQPVWSGEIQGAGLGLAVEVWNDDGNPVRLEKGELVCTKPFPSMPLKFWNDVDGAKYRSAYFQRFAGIWCHADFAEWTEHGGMLIHGRSDATLNPGGVRIGTAEIYNIVEQMDEVAEALCIGQEWDNDVRVVLFVRLTPGNTLSDEIVKSIRSKIRSDASPRHVPAKIIAVADIPRTKSGKIVEIAVRDVVHGRPVKNIEALANPEALKLFAGLDELRP